MHTFLMTFKTKGNTLDYIYDSEEKKQFKYNLKSFQDGQSKAAS